MKRKVFFGLCFVSLLLSVSYVNAVSIQKLSIEKSVIDLSQRDFINNTFELEGDVYFYPSVFLSSIDSLRKYSEIPLLSLIHSWNNQPKSKTNFPAFTYGTYYFQIKIPENFVGKTFVIRPNHFIAYSSIMFIGNEVVSHNGFPGTSIDDYKYKPSRSTSINPFIADSLVLDVFIQVANFHHFRGGFFNPIKFGLAEHAIKQQEKDIMNDLLIIVSLLIMFLYHFILFFVNFRNSLAIFFSFTCLVFAIDFSFQDTMTFFLFFPEVSFEITYLLQLSIPYLFGSSFLFFLYALFPQEVSKRLRNLSAFVSLVFVLITAFGTVEQASAVVKPHYIYVLFVIVYVYYVSIKAFANKRKGSLLFLLAYLIFSLCAVNDVLYALEIIYTASLVSTGLMVFVFLLSILQGDRMVSMYKQNKKLSDKLQILNFSLEQKVEERTSELNKSINELTKLNMFKEDMTNMVVHDLKAPLSTIINVKYLNNEDGLNLVQQSGYKMLNLVQNILGVYKYNNAKIELSKTEFRMVSVVKEAIEEVKLFAYQKSIAIDITKLDNSILNADPDLLRRVFVNLFSNAIKFSPNECIVHVFTDFDKENKCRIVVRNQGPSIPKEKQVLIFERFHQSNKKQFGEIGSTGLGLTFCKMAIEAHGGIIGVDSEVNSNTDFWFALPENVLNCNKSRSEMLLSDSDKIYLSEFSNELSVCNIYQVSVINEILNRIEKRNNSIEMWCSKIVEAAYSGENKLYSELLNL